MGFGKLKQEKEKRRKKAHNVGSGTARYKDFVPSTPEEIKGYARSARRKLRQKQLSSRIKTPESPEIRRLSKNLNLKKLNKTLFIRRYAKIMEERAKRWQLDKKNDKRWRPVIPRYELKEERSIADINFIMDIQASLAGFSWKELSRLITAAIGKQIIETDFSTAFHHALAIMHQVLGIETDDSEVALILTDRKAALKLWPVDPIGGKKVHKREAAALHAGKFGKSRDDDDDEDEDEDEEEDEPKRRKKVSKGKNGAAKKAAKSNGKEKHAKKSSGGKTKADTALELFGRKKGAHVDEVAEKLDTSVANVRSLIGALRAKGKKIVNQGDGVFKV